MADLEFIPDDIADTPVEMLLDSLSLGVMKDNMIQQISGNVSSQQNFLSIVIEKFEKILESVEDPDVSREIKQEIVEFCRELISIIVDEYGLFYDEDYTGSMDCVEILSTLYSFFVLRNKEYATEFLINYIQQNKQRLMEDLRDPEEEKNIDITTVSNKKKNLQKDNVWILSNIEMITNYIVNQDISAEQFLYAVNDGDYYIVRLIEYFEEDKLGGDFVSQYLSKVVGDYSSDTATEIRNNVRLAFMG